MGEKRKIYTLGMHEFTAVNPTLELEELIEEQSQYIDPIAQKAKFYAETPQTGYSNNPDYQK